MKSFLFFISFLLLTSTAHSGNSIFLTCDTAQIPVSFTQSINKPFSFWDKDVVNVINNELKKIKRSKYDTAFVYIEEGFSTVIDCYIIIKHESHSIAYYLNFMTNEKKYYISKLIISKFKIGDIKPIYNLVTDSNYVNSLHPDVYYTDVRQCHFYFGFGSHDKEVWAMATSLNRDTSNLMGFLYNPGNPFDSQAYRLTDYFNRLKISDEPTVPEMIEGYKLFEYGNRSKK